MELNDHLLKGHVIDYNWLNLCECLTVYCADLIFGIFCRDCKEMTRLWKAVYAQFLYVEIFNVKKFTVYFNIRLGCNCSKSIIEVSILCSSFI